MVAPAAVKVAVFPSQILGEFTETTGFGFTVTVATAVPVQPFVVPVTVYVWLDDKAPVVAGLPLNPPVQV